MNTSNRLTERLILAAVFCIIAGAFFFAAHKIREHYSPATHTRKILIEDGSINRALFAPDDDVQLMLLNLVDQEKEFIRVAVYSFTDSDIAHALIRAHKRGVSVEAIVDGSNAMTPHSKVGLLMRQRIPVWIYPSEKNDRSKDISLGIMHNKYMIFSRSLDGKSILWTGSFNFTRSAQQRNQENVIVTDNANLIGAYARQFDLIKSRCVKAAYPLEEIV